MSSPLEFSQLDSSFKVKLSWRFSASIYANSEFQRYKTTSLQKGLILTYKGHAIVGEGMGFGAPVVKYTDNMYFSKDAKILPTEKMAAIKKEFHINSVEQVKIGKHIISEDSFLSLILRILAYLYRLSAVFRKPIIKIDQFIRKRINVESEFTTAESRGSISIIYEVYPNKIHVHCDLTKLNKTGCQRIFILNEQGSMFFRKYEDSNGVLLIDNEIGAWKKVKAKRACLSDLNSSFRFCLLNIDNTNMWLGRETHEDLAWAGFIYEISPNLDFFDYDIFIEKWGV